MHELSLWVQEAAGGLRLDVTTHAQHPAVLAAMGPLREMSDDLMECKKQLKGVEKQAGSCYMQLMTCASRDCCVCAN